MRAWIGLSGRFLALAICPWRAPHAGIRGYGPRRHLEALVISARSRPLEVGSRSRRDHSRLAKPPWAVATYTSQPACEARLGHIASARSRPERPIQRRARRPAAHRHQPPPRAPGRSKADFGRLFFAKVSFLLARCHEAVSGKQSGLTGRSTLIHDAYAWAGPMGTAVQHAKRCHT